MKDFLFHLAVNKILIDISWSIVFDKPVPRYINLFLVVGCVLNYLLPIKGLL